MAKLKAEYKGYFIESCDDGTFDIVEANGEIVDGEYQIPARPLERTVRPVRHGTDCKKVEHLGDGYLHRADDNGPYDVDGLVYCGRCHEWLGTISSGAGTASAGMKGYASGGENE